MTNEAPPETIIFSIVACSTCDQLFLQSPRRDTCPTCGGGAGLEFFTFEGTQDGLRLQTVLPDLAVPAPTAAAVPATGEAPPETAAPALETGDALPAAEDLDDALNQLAIECLLNPGLEGDDFYNALLDAGASMEDASAARGRLQAVRDLIADLKTIPGVSATVEVSKATNQPGNWDE